MCKARPKPSREKVLGIWQLLRLPLKVHRLQSLLWEVVLQDPPSVDSQVAGDLEIVWYGSTYFVYDGLANKNVYLID